VKVSVIGMGYIGLPTAALLAKNRVEVVGVDTNQKVVDIINQGKIHIVEPYLGDLVKSAVQEGYLRTVEKPESSDIYMIAVPTPFKDNYEPNLSFIEKASKSIAPFLNKGNMVILESTSPVGTTEKMIEWMRSIRPDLVFPVFSEDGSNVDISVAHCPERVLPGKVIAELVENDRIIGGVTECCARKAKDFYQTFVSAECLASDCRTAELGKLVENAFRDVNIAFANELSLISDKLNINVWNLINLANHHPRVNILQPGPGVGGHCIAVDPWFIVNSAPDEAKLISLARNINDSKPQFVINKINNAVQNLSKEISKLNITCLGLAFKANVDDLRESPALVIAQKISKMNFAKFNIVEPHIKQISETDNLKNAKLVDLSSGIKDSDVIVLLVDHDLFKSMDKSLLEGKQVIDTRGIFQ
jgi:UDP-N-acetyl-D-mannosaminuronic acid dehydrogenase